MIATKSEIKALAFGNNFDIQAIKDNVITIVELYNVKSLLGKVLYDDVVANPSNYTELLEFLKPYIAYLVKAKISKPNHVKTGNKGAQTATGSNEQIADVEEAKREANSMANDFKKQIKKWLKDNGYFVNCEADNVINKIIIL